MSAAAEEEVPSYRLYTCEQGAERIGSDVIKASTLARLAREGLVPHTRNGRKVAWTDEQLAGAVAYLATNGTRRRRQVAKPSPDPASRPRGAMAPLVAKPGRRYGTPVLS
ncbi:hypothetical protein AB0C10_21560 [Microbispora amethystogenes]|uniref:hypothetical protein n=1 Tax=Microbispora amethystogenes TaxID=1427754 RepID=UPI0034001548